MRVGLGLGPVFARELVVGARRRRMYAGRAAFVGLLLLWMWSAWASIASQVVVEGRDLALLGKRFFEGMVAIQLAVVLLAAPAATAGALCIEKARGSLQHTFLTDLTAGEVVRGKLAAKLAPVLAVMASGIPVLALVGLFGGLDYAMLAGAYLVTAATATMAATVGLFLSVWARKAHQALLGAYAILAAWLLACVLLEPVFWYLGIPPPVLGSWFSHLVVDTNPVLVTMIPIQGFRNDVGLLDQLAFSAFAILLAAALLAVATWRVRPVTMAQADRPARRAKTGWAARLVGLLPGPDLDANPVLWREWHRKRPTRWVGRAWTAYGLVSLLASGSILLAYYTNPAVHELPVWAGYVNAAEVSLGLLLLGVSAASALAEERDRGILDIIMATTLSTGVIVWGKWWGAFALVARLAILPTWVTAGLAMVTGGWASFLMMIALMLAGAAMVTSLGLALATWARRPGRAILWTVAIFGLLTVGWPIQIEVLRPLLPRDDGFWSGMILASPAFGIAWLTTNAGWIYPWGGDLRDWAGCWAVCYATAALVLAIATRLTFDRRMGRIPDRPSRPRHDSPGSAGPV